MKTMQKVKLIFTVVLFSALLLICIFFILNEADTCMGVEIKDESFLEKYSSGSRFDTEKIYFNGEKVASDEKWERIYVHQPPEAISDYSSFLGTLSSDEYELYFIEDKNLKDTQNSVKNNLYLSLAAIKGDEYRIVDVVITTLPVLRLEGSSSYKNEAGEKMIEGEFLLFSAGYEEEKRYNIIKSDAQWHERGGSSRGDNKKPWKISLKNKGEKSNEELLDLGSDDDWILNPLNRDDTDIKEKFAMDLWNRFVAADNQNIKMSQGEYLELVINGEYKGLYLLQRRVDRKYLEINRESDILIKGMPTWEADTPEEAYRIVNSPYSPEKTYEIVKSHMMSMSGNKYNTEHFVDLCIFFNYTVITDNSGYKNMYYLLKWENSGYSIYLIPWDTDISLGVTWKNDNFAYDYGKSMGTNAGRMEYSKVKGFMEYNKQKYGTLNLEESIKKRWQELKNTVYESGNIESMLENINSELERSGAKIRDEKLYGLYYKGEDTFKRLKTFAKERIYKLDEYYTK